MEKGRSMNYAPQGEPERGGRHAPAASRPADDPAGFGQGLPKRTPRIRLALHEARRIAADYSKAIGSELRNGSSKGAHRSAVGRIEALLRAKSRYGIGPLYYALYQLSKVPESEWSNYITDDPAFKERLTRMSPPEDLRIAQNKALMYEHCLAHELATVPVLCVVGPSPDALAGRVPVARTLEQWREAMNDAPEELFVKSIDGTYGEGAFPVQRIAGEFAFEGMRGALDALYHYLRSESRAASGWIVQPRVRSHPGLARIVSPHGLPTVRALTAMIADTPRLLFAAFKVTVRDNTTDNFSKGKSGNLLAAVDCSSGRLGCAWGPRKTTGWPVMAPFPLHPDSREPIEGTVLPCWDALVDLAERAQASLPRFRSIGWDIAISGQGPVLVEANATYDMSVLQIAYQRGLRRELDEALNTSAAHAPFAK